MAKRALISLYNKNGLLQLGQQLVALGWELIASGGTASALQAAHIPVISVESLTNYPEMLGGRVKTLHPAVHGGIWAQDTPRDRADLHANGIEMIDLVLCNLYPFDETVASPTVTLEEAIEQIDIGGVTLLRAAAKNFMRVTVVCDPADYPALIAQLQDTGEIDLPMRRQLAVKAFEQTRNYDTAIAAYLTR